MIMCSVPLKSKIVAKSRKTNNVIHKTTSETIRLENPEVLLNNNTSVGMTAVSPVYKKVQSPISSFQITGVSLTQRHDFGEDSADESHTDDISRITDNDTPSFSEDTCSRDVEDNTSGTCNTMGSAVHTTSIPFELSSSSSRFLGMSTSLSDASSITTANSKLISNASLTTLTSFMEGNGVVISSNNNLSSARFKIVKVESHRSFSRGRWTCLDYSDKSINSPKINLGCNSSQTFGNKNYFCGSPSVASTAPPSIINNVDPLTLNSKKGECMKLNNIQGTYSYAQTNKSDDFSIVDMQNGDSMQSWRESIYNVPSYLGSSHQLDFLVHTHKDINFTNMLQPELPYQTTTVSSIFSKHFPHSKITTQAMDNILNNFHCNNENADAFVANSAQKSPSINFSDVKFPLTATYENISGVINTSNSNLNLSTSTTYSSFFNETIVPDLHSLIAADLSLTNNNISSVIALSNQEEDKNISERPLLVSPTSNCFASLALLDNRILKVTNAFQQLADFDETTVESSTSNTSTVIDTKIEKAMDLVKSHLMHTVREEVQLLKLRITELLNCISQLEMENTFLRANVNPEILNILHNPSQSASLRRSKFSVGDRKHES